MEYELRAKNSIGRRKCSEGGTDPIHNESLECPVVYCRRDKIIVEIFGVVVVVVVVSYLNKQQQQVVYF